MIGEKFPDARLKLVNFFCLKRPRWRAVDEMIRQAFFARWNMLPLVDVKEFDADKKWINRA